MTRNQARVLRILADRGAQEAASIASAASLSVFGTRIALQALRDGGCVESEAGGLWHLTLIGVDTLRAQAVGS